METAAGIILSRVYRFTLDILRVQIISSIQEGDIGLGLLRTQLQTEFELLHEKVDKLLIAHLKTAEQNVRLAMVYLSHEDCDNAIELFKLAQQNSITAFTTATTFEGKLTAVRIQLLSAFHICGYFRNEGFNLALLQDLCGTIFQQLLECAEVRSAVNYATSGGYGLFRRFADKMTSDKSQRYAILIEVEFLRQYISSAACKEYVIKKR